MAPVLLRMFRVRYPIRVLLFRNDPIRPPISHTLWCWRKRNTRFRVARHVRNLSQRQVADKHNAAAAGVRSSRMAS